MKTSKPAVYDTRFFSQLYRINDDQERKRIRAEMTRKEKYVSPVVIHELYYSSIANEGREIAKTKVAYVKQDFKIIPVDPAGDCCYLDSTKPCKSGVARHRQIAQ